MREIDVVVGNRVRSRRVTLGLSQKQLGDALGLTPQPVQKHETGVNRIAAGTLFRVAEILRAPVAHFSPGLAARVNGGTVDADRGPPIALWPDPSMPPSLEGF